MFQKFVLATGVLAALAPCASAQTMVEHSSEARFQLDLHVPDAAIMSCLPQGRNSGPCKRRKSSRGFYRSRHH